MLGAIKSEDRFGRKILICPICGHVFYKSKQYTKHINKSHIRNVPKKKRHIKKFYKRLLLIKIKEENNIPLTKYEKFLKLKANINNIKL